MTEEEIRNHKERIDKMSQVEMASLWRFAPAGHMYFNNGLPLHKYFAARFKELGGMTTEISKGLGW